MELFTEIVCIAVVSLIGLWILRWLSALSLIALWEGRKKRHGLLPTEESNKLEKERSKGKPRFRQWFPYSFYSGLYRWTVFSVARINLTFVRLFIYRHVFKMSIGKGVAIHKGLEIRGGAFITIEDGTIIGDDCLLDGRGGLTIGKNVNISSKASIYTAQHDYNDPNFAGCFGPVSIGQRAWISSNTVVLPGTTIGGGSVLAAGAVAHGHLEDYCLFGGVPAKKIRDRRHDLDYDFSKEHQIFFN